MEFFQTTSDTKSPHHIRLVEPLEFDVLTPTGSRPIASGSSTGLNSINERVIATSPSTLPRSKKSLIFSRLGQVVGKVQGSQCSPTVPSWPTPDGDKKSRFFLTEPFYDDVSSTKLESLYQNDRTELVYNDSPLSKIGEGHSNRDCGPCLSSPNIELTSILVEPKDPENVIDPVILSIRKEIEGIIAERDHQRKVEMDRIKKLQELKKQKEKELEEKIKREKQEQEKKRLEEEENKKKQTDETTKILSTNTTTTTTTTTTVKKDTKDLKTKSNVISDPIMEKLLPQLKHGKFLLDEYEKIKIDPSLKSFRLEAMKLATTTMNLCSANVQSVNEAANTLIGKLRQFKDNVDTPEYQFTITHLALQFLEQAASQIQKNPKSVWSFGVLLYLIKKELPLISSSIIGIILLDTPTAIPIFHISAVGDEEWPGKPSPKRNDLTEREVKRILAICQLYWSSLVQGNEYDEIWRLWSRILQCDLPIGLVAASCLVEITGKYMIEAFPQQGRKLVHYLREKSMKCWGNLVIKKGSTQQEKHYFTRLENLLEKTSQLGSFPEPDGRNLIAYTTRGA